MKVAVLLLLATCVPLTVANEVTPVQKVLQLMTGLLEKGEAEKKQERVQFAAYKQFCEDTRESKEKSIKKATEQIEMLKADIESYAATADKMAGNIAEHDEDISVWTGDMKAATGVRDIESADYTATMKDYSESIDALERAIQVLKKQDYNRAQAQSLVQVQALQHLKLIPNEAKHVIGAFLQQEPEEEASGLAYSPPEANAYEFQSGHVIELLEKLHAKFIAEKSDLEKEEMNSAHAFDMLMQDLKQQLAEATEDRDKCADTKAKALEDKATAEGDLADTSSTKQADEKYLTELVSTCERKAGEFVARQKLRMQELEAIQKAMQIIGGDEVAGNAEKHLPGDASLVQLKATSLGQLRAEPQSQQIQSRLVNFLQGKAASLNSRVLSALATRVSSDPFRKVRKMIKDLIVRLMEEANEEAEHHGWCQTELQTNEHTRKEKTVAVEQLHAEIDELETSVAKLGEQIAALTTSLAALDEGMAEASKIRAEEKEENEKAIADAKEAQDAVARALIVLREFYAKAAEATAFVQQQPEAPETWDTPYTGMEAGAGGVVGMLEVIQSDFARLEADTSADEVAGAEAYEEFMKDSKIDKAQKSTSLKHKTQEKQDQEQALVQKEADLEGTQKELDAALAYYDKLKPSCIGTGESFEDRGRRRKEEIESLQDALKILNGEDIE